MDDSSLYLIVKSLHIISVIAWSAALLYLPRLFVYHSDLQKGSEASELLKVMEYRLGRYIMTPAMIASWVFGLLLIFYFDVIDFSQDFWFHLKFLLVVILSGYHGLLIGYMKKFQHDMNIKTNRFFRVINEIPTILIILIVFLVILRP
ncbi:MAG: TIGR00701 family protein [Rhodobiaceae bacterium]|nr:TIGR00701 family protein [Rhodobiaceae bacterium]|tara:strand:- start:9519 stop:9962 length:444 start_codon:yes stop_codon:yes gene_type:complete